MRATIPLIDAHLDLGWCALSWDRDLTEPVETIRQREAGMTDSRARGNATVSLGEMRRGDVGLCLGTLLARAWQADFKGQRLQGQGAVNMFMPPTQRPKDGPKRIDLDYGHPSIAYAMAHGQLAYYRLLEEQGHIRLIRTRRELEAHWQQWTSAADPAADALPIGMVLSMEGADPILTPDHAAAWWEQGLRAVGPVHYGASTYAVGTGADGPLTPAGRDLLKAMEQLGMILDVTHLSDTSFFEALDHFGGPVLASHHNCRALVPGDRQLSDEQIRLLIQRGAVIGAALDAWMLYPGWQLGQSSPEVVGLGLEAVVDHIDHVCQLAGNTQHSAIGSDLDGGFGSEQTPRDLATIADLQKLVPLLEKRGYTAQDVQRIFHGNWLDLLGRCLPA